MKDLLSAPKPHIENLEKIADFAEVECLRRADFSVSVFDIARILQRVGADENLTDEDLDGAVRDSFKDFGNRLRAVGTRVNHYPYSLDATNTLLHFENRKATRPALYLFLLFASRLNMRSDRVHGGHDGTALFEELCASVAESYWGGASQGARSIVFGTARRSIEGMDAKGALSRFGDAVDQLCHRLGEGGRFRPHDRDPVRAKDSRLDIVVWRPFSDSRGGQLIGFGQCKTGSHWDIELTKLQPSAFFKSWTDQPSLVEPVRLFFVSERVVRRWNQHVGEGGILFDRCRLLEWATDLPDDLVRRIEEWVRAVARTISLNFP